MSIDDKVKEASEHLDKMVWALDDIRGDASLHMLPDMFKVIRLFKQGFNGSYKKIQQYDVMRKLMESKMQQAGKIYKYEQRRLYMFEFIKEPYSARYPENMAIRMTAHLLAHIELRYYIRQNQKENYMLKKELER
jgi:hypothetical protein